MASHLIDQSLSLSKEHCCEPNQADIAGVIALDVMDIQAHQVEHFKQEIEFNEALQEWMVWLSSREVYEYLTAGLYEPARA